MAMLARRQLCPYQGRRPDATGCGGEKMEHSSKTAVTQRRRLTNSVSDRLSLVPSVHFPMATSEALAAHFGRFIDQTDGVAHSEELFDLLSAFALNFDCPWIAYHSLSGGPAIMPKYPDEWQQRYFEMGYDRIDPIIKMSRKRASAFRWSEVYNDIGTTEEERRLFDEAATCGLRSGISVPLHGSDASLAIMSFAQLGGCEFQNKTITYLQLAALHFHLKLENFADPIGFEKDPRLSSREKECILWTARGKSSREIGIILGITVNTVNFHIKSVFRKLDTSSRTVAAIKAINAGIIEL
ncbi:putative HTH-type transcriptional regulator y4qH [Mesorhizobium sp. 113-1-2]|uniref:LuxR family transcriptional regulator n=1 Tax=Mesorhizobium sp. 113-1-2 TaxID=2744515 RepID=UPI0019360005|nr:LuxR family transcriptional regulator [Mesorhizobium sp. 113-1-2]BCG76176.1 putative HTH-type transcriptional regulator y4qH [Mesorhizobium sp. 113-1-2]